MTPDLGNPISYLVLAKGTPVLCSDGHELGRVEHVLADADADVFDGVIVALDDGGHRFVDAPEVGEIFERGIILKIDAAEAAQLPKPGPNPGVLSVSAADVAGQPRPGLLRRTWDRLSGKG